jgi:hypothetical protein
MFAFQVGSFLTILCTSVAADERIACASVSFQD